MAAPTGSALSLESCSAACYALRPDYTVAGVDDGKSCFCGVAADIDTAAAKDKLVDKTQCKGTPCAGNAKETECGAPGRLLAYQYSCDPTLPLPLPADKGEGDGHGGGDAAQLRLGHNPSLSYSMRIDV